MKNPIKIVRVAFAFVWLVVGAQHFMYADFVAKLVPAFVPWHTFWAYFTGAAMIAAGLSFIVNKKSALAAVLLGAMLTGFILLIHLPKIAGSLSALTIDNLTRPLQDIAIACAAFMLADALSKRENAALHQTARLCRYLFAILLIAFGVQQFFNLNFLTARVPDFLPPRVFWVYLTGTAMIIAGASVLANRKARRTTLLLGIFLLVINSLNYVYLLANDLHNPLLWTGAMLDSAIMCGVFLTANASPEAARNLSSLSEPEN